VVVVEVLVVGLVLEDEVFELLELPETGARLRSLAVQMSPVSPTAAKYCPVELEVIEYQLRPAVAVSVVLSFVQVVPPSVEVQMSPL